MTRVGLISDTHGLLRPEATTFLRGSDFIVHAGDVGNANVLEGLNDLAPVTAVRGNNDKGSWADSIPETEVLQVAGVRIYVLHDIEELDLDPFSAEVFGFCNRRRDQVKLLVWERNGFVLWQKRLERDRFPWPGPDDETVLAVTGRELNWLLDGIDVFRLRPHSDLKFSAVR